MVSFEYEKKDYACSRTPETSFSAEHSLERDLAY